MKETTKATLRRQADLEFPWHDLFKQQAKIIDVGSGDDPLYWDGCVVSHYDKPDGTPANQILDEFPHGVYDMVHGSQVLEHIHPLPLALLTWAKLLRMYGHIVFTVPDFDLYEKCKWPSQFNAGHVNTFSLTRGQSPAGLNHYHVGSKRWEKIFADCGLEIVRQELITTNYDPSKPLEDQTYNFEDGVECFIEVVATKVKEIK